MSKDYIELTIKSDVYTPDKKVKGKLISGKCIKRGVKTKICVDPSKDVEEFGELINNKGHIIKNECRLILKGKPIIVNHSYLELKKLVYGEEQRKDIGFKYKNKK